MILRHLVFEIVAHEDGIWTAVGIGDEIVEDLKVVVLEAVRAHFSDEACDKFEVRLAQERQKARRTGPVSDKASLMYRVLPLLNAIVPSLMASVFLLCSGCASHPHAVRPRLKVQILSQPAGARIEVNDQYVGDAPISVDIEASNDGRFWRDTIIQAVPKDTGYTQIKAFNGKSRWAISDMVPPRIFFDTRTDPGAALENSR